MAGGEMRGFTLIEVLIALCVIMVFFVGISKISVLTTRSSRYSEDLTYATALGHSKLLGLKAVPISSPSMSLDWHQDPGNPLSCQNKEFYRFWLVSKVSLGKEVRMYVAWKDKEKDSVYNFGSLADLTGSQCSKIDFADVFLQE
jgi:prepilin-type N-terminal cleavage/methylation domain-containing protein